MRRQASATPERATKVVASSIDKVGFFLSQIRIQELDYFSYPVSGSPVRFREGDE